MKADLENEYLRLAGVEVNHKKVDESPKPIQCPQCHHVAPPGSRLCPICGKALTTEVETEIDEGIKSLDEIFSKFTDAEKYQALSKLSAVLEASKK